MKRTAALLIALFVMAGILCSGARAFPENDGIWIGAAELRMLPMSGPAWTRLKAQADGNCGYPEIRNQSQMNDACVLAKALVYARTGDDWYRDEVVRQVMAAIGTETDGTTLALGRNLAAYVIAADLAKLDRDDDRVFRNWLRSALTRELAGRTLQSTHEDRPNNWGTHAGASRAAAAAYLRDEAELQRTAQVFKGWLGDRDSYAGFRYGDLSWQCDPRRPVGVNPKGCMKDGRSIDGVLPDDQRRGGEFTWPPPRENYVYEALQGALVQAQILHRAGWDAFAWEDRALLRAFVWLHEQADYRPTGDDVWLAPIIDFHYGTRFYDGLSTARPGKNAGWTDWTHQNLN